MVRKFLGYVLIHPEKQDFVFGITSNEAMYLTAYCSTPGTAKLFKDFDEIKGFVIQLDQFDFDIAKLFDADDKYIVEFETTVSSEG